MLVQRSNSDGMNPCACPSRSWPSPHLTNFCLSMLFIRMLVDQRFDVSSSDCDVFFLSLECNHSHDHMKLEVKCDVGSEAHAPLMCK
jgi:hypothetical protein